jgi:flagellar basal-body rod protein FlgF
MTGAKNILDQQATAAHNLANASSTGFRAQIDSFRAVPVVGGGLNTRAFVVNATTGTDFTPGAIQQTGRSLDVAIQGKGWLAVQSTGGVEAYTRNGALKLSESGQLQTSSGKPVLGDSGPISIPPNLIIAIAADGTISGTNDASVPGSPNIIGRLKLTNPNEKNLVRGVDGLFVTADGKPAPADAGVTLVNGAVESSNVNVVEGMVSMISLARQFEVQMKLLTNAQDNDSKATQIFSLP